MADKGQPSIITPGGSGSKRTYEQLKHELGVPSDVASLFDTIRDYCFSLGKNVVEDVRMHRIVLGKTIVLRHFADIEPRQDSIAIKIKPNRKEQEKTFEIRPSDDLSDIKQALKDAYQNVH